MGVSKVVYGGETLIDLTSDTVSPENLLDGATATNAMGEKVVGIAKGLPDQTGQSGKVLGTDGTDASWVTPPSGMIVGQSIESLIPLSDAGIRLYDGALIPSGGMYNGFVQFASALQTSNPELFCSQAEFDLSVSKYGVCSKFVNGDSYIRLPKLYSETRYLVKAWKSGTEWYNLYSDGWVEQGGFVPANQNNNYVTRFNVEFADTEYTVTRTTINTEEYGGVCNKTTTSMRVMVSGGDKARNWSAVGYAKETPDQEKIYRYICVATSVKTPVEANIDNIITDNNNKADKDFANVTKPYVVEEWHHGYLAYRKWSTGFIEQWGRAEKNETVTFQQPFTAIPNVLTSGCFNIDDFSSYPPHASAVSKTSFVVRSSSSYASNEVAWYASGY